MYNYRVRTHVLLYKYVCLYLIIVHICKYVYNFTNVYKGFVLTNVNLNKYIIVNTEL
jgi:hypothetical protein